MQETRALAVRGCVSPLLATSRPPIEPAIQNIHFQAFTTRAGPLQSPKGGKDSNFIEICTVNLASPMKSEITVVVSHLYKSTNV
jgi:hypothetical protein